MSYVYNINVLNEKKTIYDFMSFNNVSFCISMICVLLSIISISMLGFNWNIDFTGGFLVKVHCNMMIEVDKIINAFKGMGIRNVQVNYFGGINDVIVRVPDLFTLSILDFSHKVILAFHKCLMFKSEITSIEYVGPSADNDLLNMFFCSLFLALLFISIYIIFRFSWNLSIGIILSLFHDLLLTLGCISVFRIEVSPIIIVSLLSIVGYSLNDSIVVSDRIRENTVKFKDLLFVDILNFSLTQVYSRTLMTSATTFSVAAILYYFGNEIIKNFSLTMMIGIFVGTLSSIYISSSFSLQFFEMINGKQNRNT
ncbi:MAG: protein translocase subunit SecF [Buchnera aphidicola (Meitanaphis elongallis)]